MPVMMPEVEKMVVLPATSGEEVGVGATFGRIDVTIDATNVAVIPGWLTETIGARIEAVAVGVGD
jgi:predicted transcriptional regulator